MPSTSEHSFTIRDLHVTMQDFRNGLTKIDIPKLLSLVDSRADKERWEFVKTLATVSGPTWPIGTCTPDHLRQMKPFLAESEVAKLTPEQSNGLQDMLGLLSEQVRRLPCVWVQSGTNPMILESMLKGEEWYQSLSESSRAAMPFHIALSGLIKHLESANKAIPAERETVNSLYNTYRANRLDDSFYSSATALSCLSRYGLLRRLNGAAKLTRDIKRVLFLDLNTLSAEAHREVTEHLAEARGGYGTYNYWEADQITERLKNCGKGLRNLQASCLIAATALG